AEDVLQLLLERAVSIQAVQPLQEAGPLEHVRAGVAIELLDLVDRHPKREAGSDDRTGARARDVVEVPTQRLPDHLFDGPQDAEGHHAADAAAVQRQQPPRPVRLVTLPKVAPQSWILHIDLLEEKAPRLSGTLHTNPPPAASTSRSHRWPTFL